MSRSIPCPSKARLASWSILLAALVSSPLPAQDLDDPVVAKAADQRCAMEVRGRDSAFYVLVTGLVPNETFEVTSNSEGEILQHSAQADEDGFYFYIEIPLVTGKSKGIARITVAASRCRMQLSFPWRE